MGGGSLCNFAWGDKPIPASNIIVLFNKGRGWVFVCCGDLLLMRCKRCIKKAKNVAEGYYNYLFGPVDVRAEERRRICLECQEHQKVIGAIFCKICKCFIPAKAYVEKEKCPLNKWS